MKAFATRHGYTDVDPFEVVRVVSGKTIEVRAMVAEKDKAVKLEWVAGGFAGHCVNQREQRWIIGSNPQNPVVRIRLGKSGWKDRHGHRFELVDQPVKFYDYNF